MSTQSDDEDLENFECTCQLLSTVQNLVEKYKRVRSRPTVRSRQLQSTWNLPVDKARNMNQKLMSNYNSINVDLDVNDTPTRNLESLPDTSLHYRTRSNRSCKRSLIPVKDEFNTERSSIVDEPVIPAQILRVPVNICPVHSKSINTNSFLLPVVNESFENLCLPLSVTGYWRSTTAGSPGPTGLSCGTDNSSFKISVNRHFIRFCVLLLLIIGVIAIGVAVMQSRSQKSRSLRMCPFC